MTDLYELLEGGAIPEDPDPNEVAKPIFWLDARVWIGVGLLYAPSVAIATFGVYVLMVSAKNWTSIGDAGIGVCILAIAGLFARLARKQQAT